MQIAALPSVDAAAIKARVDLLALVGQDVQLRKVASTRGGEYAGPCPFCGGQDRFRVQPERGLWWCRQCVGEHWQDVIAYVERRDKLSFKEACSVLAGLSEAPASQPAQPAPAQTIDDEPPPEAWQQAAREFCDQAAECLWSKAGFNAFHYLFNERLRCLDPETIRRYHLGYNPTDRYLRPARWGLDGERKLWLPRGIVIPCEVGGVLWYVKVRRPQVDDVLGWLVGKPDSDAPTAKYVQVRGSKPALFGADGLAGHDVAVLTEGEFDAMLLSQDGGDLVGVATMGSATTKLSDRWLWSLVGARRILACYDRDVAGERADQRLVGLSDRVRVVRPVGGKDLTEMRVAGGDLRAWVRDNLTRYAARAA